LIKGQRVPNDAPLTSIVWDAAVGRNARAGDGKNPKVSKKLLGAGNPVLNYWV
jgi:hypothetical protein